ncbi:MAG: hypothetical protein JWQ04_1474 [Pedosphaera sp.]|nr:hypothetical protein [Pedosphaera sp.]
MSHYVYLYRDERGKARYVGYGERVSRANSHLIRSHNPKLADFVSGQGKFTIEVAGPFGTQEIGRLIETAVMSALDSDFNVAQGPSHARFRPLGVPDDYAERLSMPALQRIDFISAQDSPMPVLFVIVGEKNFDDGRVGYDLANPPADDQIRERVDRWWQLSGFIPRWSNAPNESPGLLIGINGSPGSQIVIASLMIDRANWGKADGFSRGEGKVRIPLLQTPKLDAFNFRGRRVDRTAKLAFDSIAAGCYIVLNLDGTSSGGRRARNRKANSR